MLLLYPSSLFLEMDLKGKGVHWCNNMMHRWSFWQESEVFMFSIKHKRDEDRRRRMTPWISQSASPLILCCQISSCSEVEVLQRARICCCIEGLSSLWERDNSKWVTWGGDEIVPQEWGGRIDFRAHLKTLEGTFVGLFVMLCHGKKQSQSITYLFGRMT